MNPRIGDRVLYRGNFGMGPQEQVTVIGTGRKNNRRLVDLDNGHWAYLDQIDKIVTSNEVTP